MATRPAISLRLRDAERRDRKSTRLNSSHMSISYAVFCLKKKKKKKTTVQGVDARASRHAHSHRPISSTLTTSFSFECSGDHRDLHSFPTRRSSDLPGGR